MTDHGDSAGTIATASTITTSSAVGRDALLALLNHIAGVGSNHRDAYVKQRIQGILQNVGNLSSAPANALRNAILVAREALAERPAAPAKSQNAKRREQQLERRKVLRNLSQVADTGVSLIYAVEDLEEVMGRDPTMLVPDLIEDLGISGWHGEPGCGKSMLAIALAVAAAAGEPFLGRQINYGEPCTVVYFALESPKNIIQRLGAARAGRNLGQRLRVIGAVPSMIEDGSASISLESWARQTIGRADLLIVDTFSTLLGKNGASETAGARTVATQLSRVANQVGAAVLYLGHNRKGGADEKGDLLRGLADSMVPIVKESEDASGLVVRLDMTSKLAKTRCSAKLPRDILARFTMRDGFLVPDGYEEVEPASRPGPKPGRPATNEAKVLDVLREIGREAGASEIEEAAELGKSTVSAALRKLVKSGKVKEETCGRRKKWAAAATAATTT